MALGTAGIGVRLAALREAYRGSAAAQAIARNSGWLALDHAFRVVTGFLVGLWVARHLGPEQIGVLNYALALVTLFGVLATLNLDAVVVKQLLDHPERQEEILATTILLRIAGSCLCVAASGAALVLLKPGDGAALAVTLLIAGASVLRSFSTVELWFQSGLVQRHIALNRMAAHVLGAALRIGLILLALDVRYFAAAILAESAALALLNLRRFCAVSGMRLRLADAARSRARELLRRASKLMLAGFVVAVFMRFDQLVLGYGWGAAKVGVYSVAVQLVEFFYFLPTLLMASAYPWLAGVHARDEREYAERLVRLLRYGVLAATALAALIAASGHAIVLSLYGAPYAEAGKVLVYYVWTLPVVAAGVILGHRYILKGTELHTLIGTAMGATTSIVLSLTLIPAYGITGALAAGIAGHVMPTLFISLFVDRGVGRLLLRAAALPVRAP